MTNDHDGRVRPGGQILEYGSWVIDGFCVANDHDGAVGREAVNHQGSRLGSEAADGVYFDCVWLGVRKLTDDRDERRYNTLQLCCKADAGYRTCVYRS